jgi:hypothetical protein
MVSCFYLYINGIVIYLMKCAQRIHLLFWLSYFKCISRDLPSMQRKHHFNVQDVISSVVTSCMVLPSVRKLIAQGNTCWAIDRDIFGFEYMQVCPIGLWAHRAMDLSLTCLMLCRLTQWGVRCGHLTGEQIEFGLWTFLQYFGKTKCKN